MSWYGSRNDGGHNKPKWGEGESAGHVHRPAIIGHNGVKHSIVDYESHNSEQYMARTAKIVKYRRFPGMADEKYIIPSRTEEYGRFNSPPSKDHHRTTHGKSGNLNFDTDFTDDDDEEEDDFSVNNTNGTRPNNMKEQEYHNDEKNNRYGFTKEGSRPNYLRDQEDYYERVNPKTNGYNPPTYTVPISTRQDKEKGNDYATRPARMGPFFGTPPRNETSYETSNFKPIANSPPQFNPQPKKEQGNYNQETIDSTEARRRYGMGAPGAGPGLYAEDRYNGGTIDSKEAARRYNGVLLTN